MPTANKQEINGYHDNFMVCLSFPDVVWYLQCCDGNCTCNVWWFKLFVFICTLEIWLGEKVKHLYPYKLSFHNIHSFTEHSSNFDFRNALEYFSILFFHRYLSRYLDCNDDCKENILERFTTPQIKSIVELSNSEKNDGTIFDKFISELLIKIRNKTK